MAMAVAKLYDLASPVASLPLFLPAAGGAGVFPSFRRAFSGACYGFSSHGRASSLSWPLARAFYVTRSSCSGPRGSQLVTLSVGVRGPSPPHRPHSRRTYHATNPGHPGRKKRASCSWPKTSLMGVVSRLPKNAWNAMRCFSRSKNLARSVSASNFDTLKGSVVLFAIRKEWEVAVARAAGEREGMHKLQVNVKACARPRPDTDVANGRPASTSLLY